MLKVVHLFFLRDRSFTDCSSSWPGNAASRKEYWQSVQKNYHIKNLTTQSRYVTSLLFLLLINVPKYNIFRHYGMLFGQSRAPYNRQSADPDSLELLSGTDHLFWSPWFHFGISPSLDNNH